MLIVVTRETWVMYKARESSVGRNLPNFPAAVSEAKKTDRPVIILNGNLHGGARENLIYQRQMELALICHYSKKLFIIHTDQVLKKTRFMWKKNPFPFKMHELHAMFSAVISKAFSGKLHIFLYFHNDVLKSSRKLDR